MGGGSGGCLAAHEQIHELDRSARGMQRRRPRSGAHDGVAVDLAAARGGKLLDREQVALGVHAQQRLARCGAGGAALPPEAAAAPLELALDGAQSLGALGVAAGVVLHELG